MRLIDGRRKKRGMRRRWGFKILQEESGCFWSGGYIPFARVEHCKYVVADGVGFWLGTSNCEKNYFYASRNLGIVGASPNLAGALSRIFLKSWTSPYQEVITQAGEYAPREHGEKK